MFLGFLLGQVLPADSLHPGGGADTAIGRFGRKNWRWLIGLVFFGIFLVVTFVPSPWKWLLVATLSIPLPVPLTHSNFFITLLPSSQARATTLSFSVVLAILAIYFGAFNADQAKNGQGSTIVDVSRSKLSLQDDAKKPITYLGYVSGYFLLLETMTGTIVFLEPKGDTPVYLLPNPSLHRK